MSLSAAPSLTQTKADLSETDGTRDAGAVELVACTDASYRAAAFVDGANGWRYSAGALWPAHSPREKKKERQQLKRPFFFF